MADLVALGPTGAEPLAEVRVVGGNRAGDLVKGAVSGVNVDGHPTLGLPVLVEVTAERRDFLTS